MAWKLASVQNSPGGPEEPGFVRESILLFRIFNNFWGSYRSGMFWDAVLACMTRLVL
jgi:hypothetical protein